MSHSIISWLCNSLAYKEFYRSRVHNTVSDTVSTFCLEMPLRATQPAPTPYRVFGAPDHRTQRVLPRR